LSPLVLIGHFAIAALLIGLSLLGASPVAAQETTGLQAAVALEGVLVDAIAQSEKSVVAIARVKRGGRDDAPRELRADPFGRLQFPSAPPTPEDPDFIPNEYGTGVVIDRRGLILTHYHVLKEDSEIWVTTVDRKPYQARIKAADPRSDLAVLSIEATDLTPIKFGDASALKKGQIVIALGNPYAIARDGQVSASWGIISNLGRKAGPTAPDATNPSGKQTLHQFGTLIQTDAKLNLGTSGGALLNLKGEMIGLTTSAAATAGYEQAAGYAVPVDDTFRRAVDALKQGREVEYGFLGIRPNNLRPEEIQAGQHGMRVFEVVAGTPAHRFGLRGDDVITQVNGKPIYDVDGLMLEVGKLPVDATARLTVERGGRVGTIHVELTKCAVRGKKIVTNPAPSWRGVRVDYPTALPDFRERQAEIELDGCVVLLEVEKDSPAWKQGLRPDMFISHVGSIRVTSPKEFFGAVAGKNGAVQVRIANRTEDRPLRMIPAGES